MVSRPTSRPRLAFPPRASRRRARLAAWLALLGFVALPGVALADDCSGPSDCFYTGQVAGAAAVGAGVAAGAWIGTGRAGEPEPEPPSGEPAEPAEPPEGPTVGTQR